MNHLHQNLMVTLNQMIENKPEEADTLDIKKIIEDATPETVRRIKHSLIESAQEMLREHRELAQEFEKRNVARWQKAFDLLETHVVICTEAGEDVNSSYRPTAALENDIAFDVVTRHHARACQISQEILCLLKSGFADAAHARWRALHEVNVTAKFIAKYGKECAERFYLHEVVDSYNAMIEHKKYEDRLQEKGPHQAEIDALKIEYDRLIERFGKQFGDYYGWASYLFPSPNKRLRIGFTSLERDVGLDHMRPYYTWASQNVHAGSKGMRNRLGLCESKENILLVGRSNSGMIDPAHATAISLCQITLTLLMFAPTFDSIVIMNVIDELQRDVGDVFLQSSLKKKLEQ